MGTPRLSEITARDAEMQAHIPPAGPHLGGSPATVTRPATSQGANAASISAPPLQPLVAATTAAAQARRTRLGLPSPKAKTRQQGEEGQVAMAAEDQHGASGQQTGEGEEEEQVDEGEEEGAGGPGEAEGKSAPGDEVVEG